LGDAGGDAQVASQQNPNSTARNHKLVLSMVETVRLALARRKQEM
jgi:hypothetical protein